MDLRGGLFSSFRAQRLRFWLNWFCGCNPGRFAPPRPPVWIMISQASLTQRSAGLIASVTTCSHHARPSAPQKAEYGHSVLLSCRRTDSRSRWCVLWPSCLVFYRSSNMGKGCMTATKYFLFLFNLIFFVSILPSLVIQGNNVHFLKEKCTF